MTLAAPRRWRRAACPWNSDCVRTGNSNAGGVVHIRVFRYDIEAWGSGQSLVRHGIATKDAAKRAVERWLNTRSTQRAGKGAKR